MFMHRGPEMEGGTGEIVQRYINDTLSDFSTKITPGIH